MKSKIIIIAEAGVNHNGKLSEAKKLIKAASLAGADYVKFQTYDPDSMIRKKTKLANYQKKNIKSNVTQYKMLKKYKLNENWYESLITYSKKNNIKFLSSPFDIKSILFLKKFNLDFIKIPSGEIDNIPYLIKIAQLKKKIILSTGMSNFEEVSKAIKVFKNAGLKKKYINILHCHSDYPSKPINLNLKVLLNLRSKLGVNIGYSDHSEGLEAPIISVAYGAKIIEKHLTLNRKSKGPDHKASLEPDIFKKMVQSIRIAEKMIGDGIKKPTNAELKNKILVRKSIVASKNIKKGEKFTENNITTKRPALGKSPMLFNKLINKRAKLNYKKDDYI